eukprot:TRINITY_DN5239_c0_g1_i2.p1 TRINITY_DN5239_c0_g1~~TRINITY_DN5239_c0_g1_i2.p1  ORF type:complete len:957 (+),score=253.52 TRINITY_DN5239_c0_g1_i2:42-2912(+)
MAGIVEDAPMAEEAATQPPLEGSEAVARLLAREGGTLADHLAALERHPWVYKAVLEMALASGALCDDAKVLVILALTQGREGQCLEDIFAHHSSAFSIHDVYGAYELLNRERSAKRVKSECGRLWARGERAAGTTHFGKMVEGKQDALDCERTAGKYTAARHAGVYATREARGSAARVVRPELLSKKVGGGEQRDSAFAAPGSTRRATYTPASSDMLEHLKTYNKQSHKARRVCDKYVSRKRQRAHLEEVADDQRYAGLTTSKLSGAMARRFCVWYTHVPAEKLHEVLLMRSPVKWKALAKAIHVNPSDLKDAHFLPSIWDAKYRRPDRVEYALGLTHAKLQVHATLGVHRVPPEYLLRKFSRKEGKGRIPPAAKAVVAGYAPLDSLLHLYPQLHTCTSEGILYDRLAGRGDALHDVRLASLLRCAMWFRPHNAALSKLLLATAERRLCREAVALRDLSLSVLCDVSRPAAPFIEPAAFLAATLAYMTSGMTPARAAPANLCFYRVRPGQGQGEGQGEGKGEGEGEAHPKASTEGVPCFLPVHHLKAAAVVGQYADAVYRNDEEGAADVSAALEAHLAQRPGADVVVIVAGGALSVDDAKAVQGVLERAAATRPTAAAGPTPGAARKQAASRRPGPKASPLPAGVSESFAAKGACGRGVRRVEVVAFKPLCVTGFVEHLSQWGAAPGVDVAVALTRLPPVKRGTEPSRYTLPDIDLRALEALLTRLAWNAPSTRLIAKVASAAARVVPADVLRSVAGQHARRSTLPGAACSAVLKAIPPEAELSPTEEAALKDAITACTAAGAVSGVRADVLRAPPGGLARAIAAEIDGWATGEREAAALARQTFTPNWRPVVWEEAEEAEAAAKPSPGGRRALAPDVIDGFFPVSPWGQTPGGAASSLGRLPEDLVKRLLGWVDGSDLSAVSSVSWQYRALSFDAHYDAKAVQAGPHGSYFAAEF